MKKSIKWIFISLLLSCAGFIAFLVFTFFIYPGTTKAWSIEDADRAFSLFLIEPIPESVEIHSVEGVTSMTGDWMKISFSASNKDAELIQAELNKKYPDNSYEEVVFEKKEGGFYFSYLSP